MLGASKTKYEVVFSEMYCQQYINSATPHSQPNQIASCLPVVRRCQILPSAVVLLTGII
jgi:hypothetical protein